MCFILALFQVDERYPLIVAANRDESRSRPALPPHQWPGEPAIWAGRDQVAGGTWLGVNSGGLLAAVTNRRDGGIDPTLPSRGQLLMGVLRQPSPGAAQSYLVQALTTGRYNPFNLLCASAVEAWVSHWDRGIIPLRPGPHVLTNRGDLDDTRLPTVRRALEHLAHIDLTTPALETLLAALGQLCADTTGPDPICHAGSPFGTVSSSLIALGTDGTIAAYWHAPGPPCAHQYVSLSLVATDASR